MRLKVQKRIAASVLKCGVNRVQFREDAAANIKEAITKHDMRSLAKQGIVTKHQKRGVSRVRANKRSVQRRLGRQSGQGSKKGRHTARAPSKLVWMAKVRSQRALLRELRASKRISQEQYKRLYGLVKGDYFRSRRHILISIDDDKNTGSSVARGGKQ